MPLRACPRCRKSGVAVAKNGYCTPCGNEISRIRREAARQCTECGRTGIELRGEHMRRGVCRTCRHTRRLAEPCQSCGEENATLRLTCYSCRRHTMGRAEAREFIAGKPCAICGEPGEAVDHDHATGAIRGVLCTHCNLGIGHLKDDPERCRAAAHYLTDAPP